MKKLFCALLALALTLSLALPALAQGAISAVQETGLLGAFTGGLSATAGGIAAAVFFGYLAALLFRPRPKDF